MDETPLDTKNKIKRLANDFKIKPCSGPNVLKQLGVKKEHRELK